MSEGASGRMRDRVETIYREESRRVFATLIRLLGDFDLAEEALHEAFRAALEQWPRDGVPENPRAWLVSAGRFKAIDGLRRSARAIAAPTSKQRHGCGAGGSSALSPSASCSAACDGSIGAPRAAISHRP